MELVPSRSATVWVHHLVRPYDWVVPFSGEPYVLLLLVAEKNVTPEEEDHLTRSIVTTGCQWAVCAGEDSSKWDDLIDWSDLAAHKFESEKANVITTWHSDETVDEVVEFFLRSTSIENKPPNSYLAVVLGGSSIDFQSLRTSLFAQAQSV